MATVQQDAQAQQHDVAQRGLRHATGQVGEHVLVDAAALATHQGGEYGLFLPGESVDVRIGHHVGTVLLVLAVRDGQPEFVHARGPGQRQAIVRFQFPGAGDLVEQGQHGVFHALCVFCVHAVACGQRSDGGIARITLLGAAEHVVEHAFAHRGFAHAHLGEPQFAEAGIHHQKAAGNDRPAIAGDALQADVIDMLEVQQPLAGSGKAIGRDRAGGQVRT